MTISYTVLEYDPSWMVHNDRKLRNEPTCDGCRHPYGDNRFVTIITDRSGSEHATAHLNNDECIRLAVEWIEE